MQQTALASSNHPLGISIHETQTTQTHVNTDRLFGLFIQNQNGFPSALVKSQVNGNCVNTRNFNHGTTYYISPLSKKVFLRIDRIGETVNGYFSDDGLTWQLVIFKN